MLAGLLAGAVLGQQAPLVLELRDGTTVMAESLTGDQKGFEARVAGRRRSIRATELLAIRGTSALAPELMRAELAGGDVVYGALVGGDSAGDVVELLSPVLSKVSVAVDRLTTLAHASVHRGEQQLPTGVDEAVFLRTGRGFDLVAGTLHRFGVEGVRFQAEAAEKAQWFAPHAFSSVRLRGALPREVAAPCTLLTRTADRLGVTLRRCSKAGLELELESGSLVQLRWPDLACLVFHRAVVHLSDLQPTEVVESGFDGAVVHPWRSDHCSTGGELLAMGRAFGRGLGVHSKSRLSFRVPKGATHLWTRVALDDTASELPVRAHAQARVLRAGKLVFEADQLRPGEPPRDTGLLPVEAGETVTFEVDFGQGRDLGDRVNWLLPMFLLRSPS